MVLRELGAIEALERIEGIFGDQPVTIFVVLMEPVEENLYKGSCDHPAGMPFSVALEPITPRSTGAG